MREVTIIAGAQFGSEGKGAVAGYLARKAPDPVAAVRVAGPNAGHTAYDDDGQPWALRCIPVAAVTNPLAKLVIAPGSEIDESVLEDEVTRLEAAGFKIQDRLFISQEATVLSDKHKGEEQANGIVGRIGSTGKGIGAARADRIMRNADLYGDGCDTDAFLKSWLEGGGDVHIEGTQGYGLGLHAGFYPQCTSSDCRAIDFLGMAGISPWAPYVSALEVVLVARTFPIRVAGNSGPLKNELTWDQVGQPEERTTVTQKVRRVGEWDSELVKNAVVANGTHVNVALMFLDYIFPELANIDHWGNLDGDVQQRVSRYVNTLQTEIGAKISYLGTGPQALMDVGGHPMMIGVAIG